MADYKITLLKGDGIGPEIVNQAVKVLDCAAEKFGFGVTYDEALLGGCAIDATGVPLPDETVAKCKASDSVLLGAVGGPKWDSQPGNNRPEAGLLGIRGALGLFANLRPSVIFGPLKSASPIKDEIIGGSVCVAFDNKILYEWFVCGRDGVYKNIFPSTLATWAAIEYAATNKFEKFDMMGAGKPEEGYGVRQFKAKFGGELVEHGRFLYVINPLLYKTGEFAIKMLRNTK